MDSFNSVFKFNKSNDSLIDINSQNKLNISKENSSSENNQKVTYKHKYFD